MTRFHKLLLVAIILLLVPPSTGLAQEDEDCPTLVMDAVSLVSEICDDTGRNEACYGNLTLIAEPQEGVTDLIFENPGDRVSVADIKTLRLSEMDTDVPEWGVGLMRLQANLPDTLPGQNVMVLLFGNVQITNAVDPAVMQPGAPVFAPMQAVYFRTGISDSPCVGAPESGILIQTPEGAGEVELTVNEVNITLGSSIFVQAADLLEVNVLDGFARLSAFGVSQTATAGTRVTVPLDATGVASAPPNPAEAYDLGVIYNTVMTVGNDIISSLPATPEEFAGQLCSQLNGMGDPTSLPFSECTKLLVAYGAVEGADEHILEMAERANAVEEEYFSYAWPYQPDDESEATAARIWQENSLLQMQEDLRALEGYIAAGKTLVLDMDLYLDSPVVGDSLRPYIDRTLWGNVDLWEAVELNLKGIYGTLQQAEVLDPLPADETSDDSTDIAATGEATSFIAGVYAFPGGSVSCDDSDNDVEYSPTMGYASLDSNGLTLSDEDGSYTLPETEPGVFLFELTEGVAARYEIIAPDQLQLTFMWAGCEDWVALGVLVSESE